MRTCLYRGLVIWPIDDAQPSDTSSVSCPSLLPLAGGSCSTPPPPTSITLRVPAALAASITAPVCGQPQHHAAAHQTEAAVVNICASARVHVGTKVGGVCVAHESCMLRFKVRVTAGINIHIAFQR